MSDDQMIRFECSVCGASMVTDGANAERVVECPQCSASLSGPYRYLDTFGEPVVQVAEEAPIEFRAPVTDSDAELDMTPMGDVTFLLLIFFMVTAAFTMQKSFQLPAPNEDVPSTQVQEDLEDAVKGSMGALSKMIGETNGDFSRFKNVQNRIYLKMLE